MCFTGQCPYEDFMGDCTIKNREELETLSNAGCNAPNEELELKMYCDNCGEQIKKGEYFIHVDLKEGSKCFCSICSPVE